MVSVEEQERKLKQEVEGALGEGPDSLIPPMWKAVFKEYGRDYLAYRKCEDFSMGWDSHEEAWTDLIKYARQKLELQKDIIQWSAGREAQKPKVEQEEQDEHQAVKRLSEQTKARADALSAFYAFRTGDDTPTQAMRVQLRPGGPQVDDDIRQVIHMQVQAWVSPEEVCDVYRAIRTGLLEEQERIQKKPSTLEIAAFAWRQRRQALDEGRELPSWAALKELWLQEHPNDNRVRGHGDFQRYFNRAKEAVIPKYRKILFPLPPREKAEFEAMKARMIKTLEASKKNIGNVPLLDIPRINRNRPDNNGQAD
jgi:hypothetical protein